MKAIFKKLRSLYVVNLILRNCILLIRPIHPKLFKKLTDHLPLQGTVNVRLLNGRSIRMFSNSDDFMLKEAYFGISDESGTDMLVSILAPISKVIIDVGANTGLFSMFCYGYNSRALIHSFEPVKSIGDRFLMNCKLNKAQSVHLHRTILSDECNDKVLYVPNSDISYSSSTLKEFHEETAVSQQKVKATTLDSFKKENSIPKLDLIKIDVEWHEYEVLKGALNVLEKDSPILIVEVLFAETEEQKNPALKGKLPRDHHHKIAGLLKQYGYYFYEIDALGLTRVDELLPGDHERNYVFSKKLSDEKTLLFSNPKSISDHLVI